MYKMIRKCVLVQNAIFLNGLFLVKHYDKFDFFVLYILFSVEDFVLDYFVSHRSRDPTDSLLNLGRSLIAKTFPISI